LFRGFRHGFRPCWRGSGPGEWLCPWFGFYN
jgi:hypothetical protein